MLTNSPYLVYDVAISVRGSAKGNVYESFYWTSVCASNVKNKLFCSCSGLTWSSWSVTNKWTACSCKIALCIFNHVSKFLNTHSLIHHCISNRYFVRIMSLSADDASTSLFIPCRKVFQKDSGFINSLACWTDTVCCLCYVFLFLVGA